MDSSSNLTTMVVSTPVDSNPKVKKTSAGRQKIEIKKIEQKTGLQVTFTKRRTGLFKKASELCVLTDAKIVIFVKSPAGRLYVFGEPDVDSLIEGHLQEQNAIENASSSLPMVPYNNELNETIYEEYLEEYEAKNAHKETKIVSSGSNDEGLGYDKCIDGMGLEELENYLCKLQQDKNYVENKANELMFKDFY